MTRGAAGLEFARHVGVRSRYHRAMTRIDAALAGSFVGLVACAEPRPAQEVAPAQPAPAPAPADIPAAKPADGQSASAEPKLPPTPADPAAAAPDAAALVAALKRSEAPLAVKVAVDDNAGFRLERLTAMYALAATPGRPSYGAPLAEPALAQDDDLLTAATCSIGQAGEPCALGLALAPGATVTMLRLFLAAGPDYRDYVGAPRPKRLAIHTDAGRVELDYPDGATERWLIFAEPVTTAGVSVEVLAVHPGRKDAPLHFAEVEVYGTAGPARPPLELAPEDTFVYFETEPWKAKGDGQYTVKMTWLEHHTGEEQPIQRRRWIRGAAAHGRRDDRFVLVERGLSATCDAPGVGYLLVDRETRMIYPLGPFAGGGATFYRHFYGTGFLAVPPGEDAIAGIRTIEFNTDTKTFARRRGKPGWTLADHLREWKFDPHSRRSGGRDLDAHVADPESKCEALTGAAVDRALAASKVLFPIAPGEWWSCPIGDGHEALLGRDRACGEVVSILIKPPAGEGEIVRIAEFGPGDGPRRIAAGSDPKYGGLLVEVGKRSGASSDLVPLDLDELRPKIVRNASLIARPPAECGACLLEYAASSAAAEAAPEQPPAGPPADG